MKPIVAGSLVALTALSLTANVLLYLRWSSTRPLATVGTQVITKKEYADALDYQTHGAVLRRMVLADVVGQAAARAGLTPSAADVDARVADLRRRDPQSLASADQDPTAMTQVRQDVRTELALENLRTQGISVSGAEVAAYYGRHKEDFDLPAQAQATVVVAENPVDAAQADGLLRQGIALDVIARQPRLHVDGVNGYQADLQALPPAVSKRLNAGVFGMRPGDVRTFTVGKDYLVIRATRSAAAGVPPLAQIRPEVTRLARLEKAPSASVELARLYQAAKPEFAVTKYEYYFDDLSRFDFAQAADTDRTASAQ